MTQKTLFSYNLTIDDVKELIKNGADVNEKDGLECTPLFYVSNIEIAKLLIENGADVNRKNFDDETCLYYVKNTSMAELFIKHGADVNHKNKYGRTPLHQEASLEIIKCLVNNNADVNATSNTGVTPIFCWSNKTHICYLLENGANINVVDKNQRGILRYEHNASWNKFFIQNGAVASSILIYRHCRELFTKKQQEVFDAFVSITSNDDYFFQMCLAYQNDQKNNVKIEIKDLDIL